jgi:radical SAM superfamily enzyme YgiQ (UPF0313 family)
MKCVLIIPRWAPEDIFSSNTAGSQINYWQPLGTLYVAASLLEAGHEVKFLNGAFMSGQKIMDALSDACPDFVGIYSTTFGWKKAVQTAEDVRRILPESFIAVGGPYPIALQERCLHDAYSADAAVTGEGEVTVVEMVERLSQGRSLDGIEGVAFRDGGKVRKNPPRPLIKDLDSLPFPARELLGEDNYIPPPATYKRKPVAVMMTSRGCNRRCIFCFQIDRDRSSGIRYRSIDSILKEIDLCLRQGYREIKFIDDSFVSDYGRARELAEEIKSRRLDFTWFASACVHQVDKSLLTTFREAGCWAILLGAESGVQKNLNSLRKGTSLEQIRMAVKDAKDAGLKVFTPFLFGIPGETYEEALKTIEFACEIDPDVANFHSLTPFPGTELYDNREKLGTVSEDLSDYTYQGAAFVPKTMTREEIRKVRQMAFRRFYSRPRFLLRRILVIRSLHDIRAALTGIKSLFWIWAKKDIFSRGESFN